MRPHPVFLKDYDNSYNDEEKNRYQIFLLKYLSYF